MGAHIGVPGDTAQSAAAVQLGALRSLSGSERVAIAFQLSAAAREVSAAGIRARHPEYSNDEVEHALRRLTLGDDLFEKAYPDAPNCAA
jgi:hypothetical protein